MPLQRATRTAPSEQPHQISILLHLYKITSSSPCMVWMVYFTLIEANRKNKKYMSCCWQEHSTWSQMSPTSHITPSIRTNSMRSLYEGAQKRITAENTRSWQKHMTSYTHVLLSVTNLIAIDEEAQGSSYTKKKVIFCWIGQTTLFILTPTEFSMDKNYCIGGGNSPIPSAAIGS